MRSGLTVGEARDHCVSRMAAQQRRWSLQTQNPTLMEVAANDCFEPIVTPYCTCNIKSMKRISIDISSCRTAEQFYSVLLSALQAPDWHGYNLDALWDSITSDINDLLPPYTIEVSGSNDLPRDLLELLHRIEALFKEARDQEHLEIAFKVG